jgi:hypothetical protein
MSEQKKWTATDAGPRQINAVNKALSAIRWNGKTVEEIHGVHGQPETERRMRHIPMVTGGMSEFAAKAWDALGEQFNWTITKDNAKTVTACAEALIPEINKHPIISDLRKTADVVAEEDRKHAEFKAASEIKANERAAEVQKIVAELRAKYPWANSIPTTLSPWARAAACIKRELIDAFPGISFTVKSESYSMGNCVNIRWTLGPTTKQVDEIVGKYQDGHFDGMQDMYVHDNSAYNSAMEQVLAVAKNVSPSREIPRELREQLKTDLTPLTDRRDYELEREMYELVGRTSFAPNEQYAGVKWNDEGNDFEIVKLTTTAPLVNAAVAGPSVTVAGITVTHNTEHDGIEIHFPTKPDQSVIDALKAQAFRWSMRNRCWYKKNRPGVREWAESYIASLAPVAEGAIA